ncbi:MAG: hypothetical protein ACRER8_16810 [Pseudomonas sp.]|uniref:hypothetical protein n=1 Tax=Pseudomonas sp. TaxID=306 RepID=UPI003D6EE6CF
MNDFLKALAGNSREIPGGLCFWCETFGFYCHQDEVVAELPTHPGISSAASFIRLRLGNPEPGDAMGQDYAGDRSIWLKSCLTG